MVYLIMGIQGDTMGEEEAMRQLWVLEDLLRDCEEVLLFFVGEEGLVFNLGEEEENCQDRQ